MPIRPTRIDDCGASALSTRKMRVAGAAPSGAGSFGAAPALARHFANAASSLLRSAFSVVSPATSSAALLGR
jgi:hypothetical protein